MKDKLREYLDAVFADAESRAADSRRVRELKEEMLGDLCDKYDDLIAKGKTPSAAYNAVIAGLGDISDLLESVGGRATHSTHEAGSPTGKRTVYAAPRPLTQEEQEILRRYKSRSAVLTSLAVALYILCWVPLAILNELIPRSGGIVGLTVMFLMIAGATAMLIYNGMTKPKLDGVAVQIADDDDDDDDDDNDDDGARGESVRPRRSSVYKAISGALWMLTVCAYLLVSFATGAWYITWMMFLITTAIDNIIKAIFDLRR